MLNIITSDDFPLGWLKVITSMTPILQETHSNESNEKLDVNFSISKNRNMIVLEVEKASELLKTHTNLYNVIFNVDIYTQHICMFCAKPGYTRTINTLNFVSCESCFSIMKHLQTTGNNLGFDGDFETIKNMELPIINYNIPEYYNLLLLRYKHLYKHINTRTPITWDVLESYNHETFYTVKEDDITHILQNLKDKKLYSEIRRNIGENIKPFMYIQNIHLLDIYLKKEAQYITEQDMDIHLGLIKNHPYIYEDVEKIYLEIFSKKDFYTAEIKKI